MSKMFGYFLTSYHKVCLSEKAVIRNIFLISPKVMNLNGEIYVFSSGPIYTGTLYLEMTGGVSHMYEYIHSWFPNDMCSHLLSLVHKISQGNSSCLLSYFFILILWKSIGTEPQHLDPWFARDFFNPFFCRLSNI